MHKHAHTSRKCGGCSKRSSFSLSVSMRDYYIKNEILFSTLSLITEGATEKVLQFIMPL
jgi:hypothetical protein